MAKFVITRADGTNDIAEGTSVEDVSNRYGWPGNGDITEWAGDNVDNRKVRHKFDTPDDQDKLLNKGSKK